MIKIYRLRQVRNNVSHVLVGKGGNTMRYNFTGGNVALGTCPEIALKSAYAQELLEASELYRSGTVVKVREVRTPEDERKAKEAEQKAKAVSEEEQVTTPDELLVYVNANSGKKFTDPAKALAWAAKEGVVFKNLEIGG